MSGRDGVLAAAVAAVGAAGLAAVAGVLDGGVWAEVEIPGGDVAGVERLLGVLAGRGLVVAEVWSTATTAVLAVAAGADVADGFGVCGAGSGKSRGLVGAAALDPSLRAPAGRSASARPLAAWAPRAGGA